MAGQVVRFITDFADQAVILPLVVAVGVGLLAQGWRRGAAAWLAVIGVTFGVVIALKIGFALTSELNPSGHVAAATLVVGGLATLARRGLLIPLLALTTAAVIGTSRIVLGAHSPPDVLLGTAVGLIGMLVLRLWAGRPRHGLRFTPIVALAVASAVLCHGWHFHAEAHIRATALQMAHLFR